MPNYPTSLNPATDGLRNITGKVNGDGTVTVWGVTSTVSANGDQGADPNKLVPSPTCSRILRPQAVAANEQFTVIKSAAAGEVLRGVALAPTAGQFDHAKRALVRLGSPASDLLRSRPGGWRGAYGQNLAAEITGQILGPRPSRFRRNVRLYPGFDRCNNVGAVALRVAVAIERFLVPDLRGSRSSQSRVTSAGLRPRLLPAFKLSKSRRALFSLNGLGLATAHAVRVSGGDSDCRAGVHNQSSFGTWSRRVRSTWAPAPIRCT